MLFLGHSFNMTIAPEVLPNDLQMIVFGDAFEDDIERGVHPKQLVFLSFGIQFNRRITPGVLPNNLRKSVFWKSPSR
jgi:hypothetical protein